MNEKVNPMKSLFNVCIIAAAMVALHMPLHAQVTTAMLPFEGDDQVKYELQEKIKSEIIKLGGVTIIADDMMKNIMKIHENAQAMGSTYHDISKLKVAEFMITGKVMVGQIQVKVVDINQGTEFFSKLIELKGDNKALARKIGKDINNAILARASTKNREVPSEAKPYMDVVKNLLAALPRGDEACYPYISFYQAGSYKRPRKEAKELADSAKTLLQEIRPTFTRANNAFMKMENNAPWVYIYILSDKMGTRSKHKFGITEMEDGSLTVGIYELMP
jgi:hypothetical protein